MTAPVAHAALHGAELVLHGHNHRDSHVDFAFAHGHIPVVGLASSSAGRAHKSEPLGRYNLVCIGRLDGAVHIEVTTRDTPRDSRKSSTAGAGSL